MHDSDFKKLLVVALVTNAQFPREGSWAEWGTDLAECADRIIKGFNQHNRQEFEFHDPLDPEVDRD